jgi:hypothetical protein
VSFSVDATRLLTSLVLDRCSSHVIAHCHSVVCLQVKLWVQKELPSVLAVDTDADIDAVAGKGGVEGVIAVFDISQVRASAAHTHIA